MSQPDPFDVDALRVPGPDLAALRDAAHGRPPRHRPGDRFLRGPVPWDWLRRAAALPGKALAAGLLLWLEAGCARSRTVRFSKARSADLGCHPHTVRRGLRQLEGARLVSVERLAGRSVNVTLLDARVAPGDGPAATAVRRSPPGPADREGGASRFGGKGGKR